MANAVGKVATNLLAKKAAEKASSSALDNFKENFDSEDPFYYGPQKGQGEVSEKQKKKGRKFKIYKGKKMYRPPGLEAPDHDHDIKILASVRRRAWHLDMSLFHWCGFRFGWSALIGLIPVLGDVIDCLLAFWIIRKANQIHGGLPPRIQRKMYFNVAADFAIGLVPLLGDIADALYKANSRNTWLLEDYLTKKAVEEAKNPHPRGHTDDPELGLTRPGQTKTMSGAR